MPDPQRVNAAMAALEACVQACEGCNCDAEQVELDLAMIEYIGGVEAECDCEGPANPFSGLTDALKARVERAKERMRARAEAPKKPAPKKKKKR